VRPKAGIVLLGSLTEQAAVSHKAMIVGGELHIGGGHEEHPIANALHLTPEAVAKTTAEVDKPTAEIGVGLLQIQDDGCAAPKPVGYLLGVVKATGRNQLRF
jgi:hypothetical protein